MGWLYWSSSSTLVSVSSARPAARCASPLACGQRATGRARGTAQRPCLCCPGGYLTGTAARAALCCSPPAQPLAGATCWPAWAPPAWRPTARGTRSMRPPREASRRRGPTFRGAARCAPSAGSSQSRWCLHGAGSVSAAAAMPPHASVLPQVPGDGDSSCPVQPASAHACLHLHLRLRPCGPPSCHAPSRPSCPHLPRRWAARPACPSGATESRRCCCPACACPSPPPPPAARWWTQSRDAGSRRGP